jgi:hypothetical protein
MGKLSLLSISFSLMLLGAFTFLGGFLLGIWVVGSQNPQPLPPTSQAVSSMPEPTHGDGPVQSILKDLPLDEVPSPLVQATQEEAEKEIELYPDQLPVVTPQSQAPQ